MKFYIFCLLAFLSNLCFAQTLDSTISYAYHETMPRGIAKSYWNYYSSLDLEISKYYIMDRYSGKFNQINTQILRYLPNTKIYSSLVTIDYPRQYVDSTVYIYNDDSVNVAILKFRKRIAEDEYALSEEIIHKNLDKTNRKTTEEIILYKRGLKAKRLIYIYEYTYNNKDELISKIKYELLNSNQKKPIEKLIQNYDENGKISEVILYDYNSISHTWEKIRSHEFEYGENYQNRTEIFFDKSSGENKLSKTREMIMLDESSLIKEMKVFIMDGEQKKPLTENFYFYSE